jgi:hypothetical protein
MTKCGEVIRVNQPEKTAEVFKKISKPKAN